MLVKADMFDELRELRTYLVLHFKEMVGGEVVATSLSDQAYLLDVMLQGMTMRYDAGMLAEAVYLSLKRQLIDLSFVDIDVMASELMQTTAYLTIERFVREQMRQRGGCYSYVECSTHYGFSTIVLRFLD